MMSKKMTIEDLGETIEDLAVMVQGEFSRIQEELNGFHGEFAEVKDRLRGLDNKFDAMQIELLDIKKKLDNAVYRHEFEFLRERVKELEQRVAKLSKK